MKILAIEKDVPGVTDDKFTKEILKAEARKVWEFYQQGIIRELYFHKEEHSAVLILECSNVSEVKNYLDMLPLVKNGLIDFNIIPLSPYPGFERLFD